MSRIRTIHTGEAMAIDAKAIHAGQGAFFSFWASPDTQNERVGVNKDITVVHIRGSIDHHPDGGDSYDAIRERVRGAIAGTDCEDEEEGSPPKAVVLRIDSPGGAVSGLNETVYAIRKMSAQAGIPIIAYADEMAGSAAYALACAAEEIYLPASGIVGSVGVISMIPDTTVADKKAGLRITTLVSGARKGDGHPHVATTDAAIAAEQKRIDKLAKQFYRLVQTARGLSPETLQGYEAGVFLGYEAVKAGLADGLMSWDDVVSALSDDASQPTPTKNTNPSSAKPLVSSSKVKREEATTMLKLTNLIKQTKAAIASEKDVKKLSALTAQLASFKDTLSALSPSSKMTHKIEHKEVKTSDGDDDGGDDEDKDDDSEEDEASEAAEGNETDRSDKPETDEEDEDEEDEESEESEAMSDEESEEEAAAAKPLRAALKGVTDKKARAALQGQLASVLAKASKFDKMGARLAQLEKDTKARQKAAMIDGALAKRRITPGEAKQLASKSLVFTKNFLSMRPKAIVHSTQEDLALPKGGAKGSISSELMAMFQSAVTASNGKIPIEKFIEDYKAEAKNGIGTGEY